MKEYLHEKDYEEIYDIHLAAACALKGMVIEAYNKDPKNSPRVGFIFRKNERMKSLVNLYLAGQLLVEPKEYAAKIRDLKTRTKIPY